jgi:hypothetical protein
MPRKVTPVVFAGVAYPNRTAAAAVLAPLVPCSTHAAWHMLRACAQDGEAALERLRAAKATRDRQATLASIARESSFSVARLEDIMRRDGLSLAAVADWARTYSRQIIVDGKVYRHKHDYFRALRRFAIPQSTLKSWVEKGVPLEDLAAKARDLAKRKHPDRFHSRTHYGEVSAYGWRWKSRTAFCFYYFGHAGTRSAMIRRAMERSRTPMSYGKAALEYVLHLFDIGELCADCRWPPEREATINPRWLPLNTRDERGEDELNMAAFHAGIQQAHARERARGEQARRERADQQRA